jgi:hypothetical protein
MIDEETIAKIIGNSVGTYPKDIENMLVSNNVLAPAPQYTIDQLVDGVLIGLNENPSFTKEYSSWLEQIITTLTF